MAGVPGNALIGHVASGYRGVRGLSVFFGSEPQAQFNSG
jgi:hypothetical protein